MVCKQLTPCTYSAANSQDKWAWHFHNNLLQVGFPYSSLASQLLSFLTLDFSVVLPYTLQQGRRQKLKSVNRNPRRPKTFIDKLKMRGKREAVFWSTVSPLMISSPQLWDFMTSPQETASPLCAFKSRPLLAQLSSPKRARSLGIAWAALSCLSIIFRN